jgi:hypothetical protein
MDGDVAMDTGRSSLTGELQRGGRLSTVQEEGLSMGAKTPVAGASAFGFGQASQSARRVPGQLQQPFEGKMASKSAARPKAGQVSIQARDIALDTLA